MKTRNVAVIDVGSNTIKLLVASRSADGSLAILQQVSDPTRIGSGIGSESPVLSRDSMLAGLATIAKLLDGATVHSPSEIRIVATGAVREAANGKEFANLILQSTGHSAIILSGGEEASGIAAGLITDPALASHHDFLACDLGGGSMELILVSARSARAKVSLPLGAVRLTERFIAEPQKLVSERETEAISEHVQTTLAASEFPFPEASHLLVATGGAFATARAVLADREGIPFEKRSLLSRQDLTQLLQEISSLSLDGRLDRFPSLPPNRADVMPAALACIVATLDHAHASEVRNSLRNLRYGIAAELLAENA